MACRRHGLTFWESQANFVLIRAGRALEAVQQRAAERGIYLRDRSTEPGCDGCLRVSAGVVDHTDRFIALMDEVL